MTHDVDTNKTIFQILESYLHANYKIPQENGDIVIKIGQPQAQLDSLLKGAATKTDSWAIISAFNPGSNVQSNAVNQRSNQRLEDKIIALGLTYWLAISGDCQHDFPDEEGFLITGISQPQLAQLAIEFGQNAVVYGKTYAAARLLILADVWQHSSQLLSGLPDFVDFYGMKKDAS